MTEDGRSPGSDEVGVLASIGIGDGASLGLGDKKGITSHSTESPDGGIHSTGNMAE